ncbi:hypothetical protein LZ30DRAFT_726293 [Colletotrichum cereale]|nr:hypothetical protein LZ30DRAFT_726293 [Colletotrichum cereale]
MRTRTGLCCMQASGTKFARPVTGFILFYFFRCVAGSGCLCALPCAALCAARRGDQSSILRYVSPTDRAARRKRKMQNGQRGRRDDNDDDDGKKEG